MFRQFISLHSVVILLLCLLTQQASHAGGRGYVEGQRINELIFSVGYGEQGGSDDSQVNKSIGLDYQFLSWRLTDWLNFYLGGGYTQIRSNTEPQDTVNAISFGPGLKFFFAETKSIKPFFYLAIVPTYIDSLQLGSQTQGSHFLFSDPFGFGLYFGDEKEWIATIGWHHLSNGNLFPPNPGYDVPINIGIGRRF